jgi:hypothetical protein
MKLVMTLLARDEADIVDAQVTFHLNSGVDFVVATDNRSEDGTTEILERYAREGHLHLIREEHTGYRQSEWVTRMARLAATDFAADWVINSDADEFWWPRGSDLKDVLAAIPKRYGVVRGLVRPFIPCSDDGGFFAERMTIRLTPRAPINDPSSQYRPQAKVAHRGDPSVVVGTGNHAVTGVALMPLRGWYPIEVLHFPVRSKAQLERKAVTAAREWRTHPTRSPTAYNTRVTRASQQGQVEEQYASLALGDDEVSDGVRDGRLAVDTRVRDALRTLRVDDAARVHFTLPTPGTDSLTFDRPTVLDDAAYAVDVAALGEADVVRLQRHVDALEQRLRALELRLASRIYRRLFAAAKSLLSRGDDAAEAS